MKNLYETGWKIAKIINGENNSEKFMKKMAIFFCADGQENSGNRPKYISGKKEKVGKNG